MVYILRLWLIMKDFLNRSVLHVGVLKILIDLKCLQLVFLGGRRLASLWSRAQSLFLTLEALVLPGVNF